MVKALRRWRKTAKPEACSNGNDVHLTILGHFVDPITADATESPLFTIELSLETQRRLEVARERLKAAA